MTQHYFLKDRFCKGPITPSPTDTQWLYGSGFFETILYNGKQICHITPHLQRIHKSLAHYKIEYPLDVPYQNIFLELLENNRCLNCPCRINIYYILKPQAMLAYPLITVIPYTKSHAEAIKLSSTTLLHVSHLNAHKTLSYLPYTLAYNEALRQNSFDAVLVNEQQELLECTRAALLFESQEGFFKIENKGHILPSISLELLEQHDPIQEATITLDQLAHYKHAYYLNSLVGILPVASIDEYTFKPNYDFAQEAATYILENRQKLSLS